MMILHGQAVMRGARTGLVGVDMPFGSYEADPHEADVNATRGLKETGAQAIKLESGPTVPETIAYLDPPRRARDGPRGLFGPSRCWWTAASAPRAAPTPNAASVLDEGQGHRRGGRPSAWWSRVWPRAWPAT